MLVDLSPEVSPGSDSTALPTLAPNNRGCPPVLPAEALPPRPCCGVFVAAGLLGAGGGWGGSGGGGGSRRSGGGGGGGGGLKDGSGGRGGGRASVMRRNDGGVVSFEMEGSKESSGLY